LQRWDSERKIPFLWRLNWKSDRGSGFAAHRAHPQPRDQGKPLLGGEGAHLSDDKLADLLPDSHEKGVNTLNLGIFPDSRWGGERGYN